MSAEQKPSAKRGACEVFAFDADLVEQARKALPDDDVAQRVAQSLKLLAHPTRIRILRALKAVELCVCDLAQALGMSVSAVSHQLRLLCGMGVVRYRTEGKMAYYSVVDHDALAILDRCIKNATPAEEVGT